MRHSLTRASARATILAIVLAIGVTGLGRANDSVVEIHGGSLTARVRLDRFGISFEQPGGGAPSDVAIDPLDSTGRYGTLAFAIGAGAAAQPPYAGYGIFADAPARWFHATRAADLGGGAFLVSTDDPTGRTFALTVRARDDGVLHVTATLSNSLGVLATGWSFARGDGERFLGFGERSDGADQTGKIVENWNEEGPWSGGSLKPATDPALGDRWQGPLPFDGTNFPMPWLVSSRGYGFLLDQFEPSRFRLASDRTDAWQAEVRAPAISYRVYAGPTPARVLERFTTDTGRQPQPAKWFFGPWYQPAEMNEMTLADKFRGEWDIPATVSQTYTHYLPCGPHLSNRQSHKDRVAAYHERGLMVTTYVNSFVCEDHPGGAYATGDANGHFVKTRAGTTYPVPYVAYYKSPWHGLVDFTSDAASRWWESLARDAVEDGYDGWMEDFGEYVPPDAVMSDGRSGFEAHNEYCTLFHKASDELTRPVRGDDFAQFVRCGNTGTARYARIVWGGDPSEDFSKADGLGAAVSQGISMGLSGIAYWGTDIGGYHALFHTGRTGPELLSRWLEFGAFAGIMRTEADGYGRPEDPERRSQVWDDDVRPIWRKYSKLRTQLFPYIWNAAMQYRDTGMPIIRHLGLTYPADANVWTPAAEYEYLFGPDILVAPVIEDGARARDVYLPPGEWINFWDAVHYNETTGSFDRAGTPLEPISGGKVVTVNADLDRIPLFVRAGACLPMLPANVDTIADAGSAPDLVHANDVAERALEFGGDCA